MRVILKCIIGYLAILHIFIIKLILYVKKENSALILDKPNCTFLIAFMTAPSHTLQRDVIRRTWLSLGSESQHYFFINSKNIDKNVLNSLGEENKLYHDIVFLKDIEESYYNISLKLLYMVKWSHENYDFKFFIKSDDDTFIKLDVLEKELNEISYLNGLYLGYFSGRATVLRSGKWAELSWFLCDKYLPYARGGSYIISYSIAHYISINSNLLQIYNNEDTSMGVWTAPLNITRIHDIRFNTEYISRGCNQKYIVMHKQNSEQIQKMFSLYKNSGKICDDEYEDMQAYIYNWSVLPSDCCYKKPIEYLL